MAPKAALQLDTLHDVLSSVFNQVQASMANHKKNCVNLYKIHVQAAAHIESTSKATVKLVGEDAFQSVFLDMLSRALTVKKGVASADRTIRFIGSYVKYINEKVRQEKTDSSISTGKHTEGRSAEDEDEEDTFVSRFVSRLLSWILRGFLAKDKNVRYRSVFIVSEMVLWLGQLDMDVYESLRETLIERLCDKEASIRAQSVIALGRLSSVEDPSDVEAGERTIQELLMEVLVYDDEPEVRRAALVSLPLNRATIDVVISCSRDTDLLTRKLLYSGVLYSKLGDPRLLTLVQREKLIKDGLGDREGSVRAAVSKLIVKWFDIMLAEGSGQEEATWDGDDGGVMKAFIRFLELFDVVGSQEIALDAINAIFILKPDLLEVFSFSDTYWTRLTPESATLARLFVNHCQGSAGIKRVDEVGLPMVTAFAFYIQSLYNKLLEALQIVETAEVLPQEEDLTEALEQLHKVASILSSILCIAAELDYGDEIGRRKAFSVVKDMLTHPTLPLDLVDPCMDVMRAMLPSEQEFIRVVVEIIIDLRDGEETEVMDIGTQDKSFSDTSQSTIRRERSFRKSKDRSQMSKDKRDMADVNDIRCLIICNSVLERVNGPFEDNSTLQGILDDLIIPSAQRREMVLREKALTGLGLCSLIAKKMALGSFQLFSNECIRAPTPIRVVVLQVVFDLLLIHEKEFFGKSEEMDTKLVTFLLSIIENEFGKDEPSSEVLAVLCTGFSKLLLLGIVNDPKMLLCLLVAYVSPDTAGNQEARQCLSYFFARYSVAHPRNKTTLQSIFMTAFDTITRMNESLEEDQTMVIPEKFGEMLLAWTDPQFGLEAVDIAPIKDNHANVVIDILLAMYDSDRSDADLKTLCHLLNQPMYWPDDIDYRTIHMIDLLLSNHQIQCPFDVAATAKAFERFKTRFNKIYSTQLTAIDPRKYVHDDEIQRLYKAINVDVPDSDGEMGSWSPLQKGVVSAKKDCAASPVPSGDDNKSILVDDPDEGDDDTLTASRAATPGLNAKGHHRAAVSAPVTASKSVTPNKKGTKRTHTPGSGILTPAERKRNRARTSLASRNSELESDDGNTTPTPVKPKSRAQARTRAANRPRRPTLPRTEREERKNENKKFLARSSGRVGRASASLSTAVSPAPAAQRLPRSRITGPAARGKRKIPTPPPLPLSDNDEDVSDESREAEVSRDTQELRGPVEPSSDDLATYSDSS